MKFSGGEPVRGMMRLRSRDCARTHRDTSRCGGGVIQAGQAGVLQLSPGVKKKKILPVHVNGSGGNLRVIRFLHGIRIRNQIRFLVRYQCLVLNGILIRHRTCFLFRCRTLVLHRLGFGIRGLRLIGKYSGHGKYTVILRGRSRRIGCHTLPVVQFRFDNRNTDQLDRKSVV